MLITYRTLSELIDRMSDKQKDSFVTVEDIDNECFVGELRIAGSDHSALHEGCPVFVVHTDLNTTGSHETDIDEICKMVGLDN